METRAFDHILVIMFENEYRGYVLENPYMRNLAQQGILLANSFGVMHPSQTNYITSIAGELCNVTDDEQPQPLPQNTIVDLIENSPQKLRWKAYMESYVAADTPWHADNFSPRDHYPYVIKHNPFSSFKNILDNRERWQKIDNEAGFWRDLLNGDFPEYAWFTPNMWSDGHYLEGTLNNDLKGERAPVLVDQQAAWLQTFFAGLNFPGPHSKLPPNTLVVVTYDEADFEAFYDQGKKYTYDGPNQIYTVLLGDGIKPGLESEGYNHYSLLKTIEKNFTLGDLQKNDRDANWFQFLWGRSFRWQPARETPLRDKRRISATAYRGRLHLFSENEMGHLSWCTFDGNEWSPEITLAEAPVTSVCSAANNDELLLVYCNADQQLAIRHYRLDSGWSDADTPDTGGVQSLSLLSPPRHNSFLMVYRDSDGALHSLDNLSGNWQPSSGPVCTDSEGDFTLAALGPTILLVYNVAGSDQLACLSYNTATFNGIDVSASKYAGPYDNTTINRWSPGSFALNYFSEAPSSLTPGEPEPDTQVAGAGGTLASATLDGVLHLLHNGAGTDNPVLLEETFSISGTLTPENPVSYDPAKNDTTSNGYGTLAEAGWTRSTPVADISRHADSALAIAHFDNALWLLFQPLDSDHIHLCRGAYFSREE